MRYEIEPPGAASCDVGKEKQVTWTDQGGQPLNYAEGDVVAILWENPYPPGPLEGWVRGYDLVTGAEPAYYVFNMGREVLIRESGLKRLPTTWNSHHCLPGRNCGICGRRSENMEVIRSAAEKRMV